MAGAPGAVRTSLPADRLRSTILRRVSEKLFEILERVALYVLIAAVVLLVATSLLLVLEFVRVMVR